MVVSASSNSHLHRKVHENRGLASKFHPSIVVATLGPRLLFPLAYTSRAEGEEENAKRDASLSEIHWVSLSKNV
jgi:hypothetical protein